MTEIQTSLPVAVSDTGPLISIFQSDSWDVVIALMGRVDTSEMCQVELVRHGWQARLDRVGVDLAVHKLTDAEMERASELARRIAAQPVARDRAPDHHLGEAEVMVLAQRAEFGDAVVLLDERAARAVAQEIGLTVSGFAGVLLMAVEEGWIGADEVKRRLEHCLQLGTHYSAAFIDRVYQAAQESER